MTISRDVLKDWHVLVIDDEPDSLEVACMMLEHYGATVTTASDGKEALRMITEKRPKLIISDISMPVMDGWSLIQELKNDRALMDIPVVALTAHAMRGDRERAVAAGFHNYLIKPLTPSTFIYDLLNLLVDIPVLAGELRQIDR